MRSALAMLDLLVNGLVEATPIAAPPAAPVLSTVYRVAATGASGIFPGYEGSLAAYSAEGWRLVTPVEGMRLTDRTFGVELAFRGGNWTSGSYARAKSRSTD